MDARRLGTGLVVAAVFVSGAVWAQQANAQQTVAKLKDIQGTVLVSQGDAMAAGAKDQALRAGTRVVTSAGSTAVISYDKGCDVSLKENQRFTVREMGECAALIASVEGTGAAAMAGASGAGGMSGMMIAGGVVVAGGVAYAVDRNRSSGNVSPSK